MALMFYNIHTRASVVKCQKLDQTLNELSSLRSSNLKQLHVQFDSVTHIILAIS